MIKKFSTAFLLIIALAFSARVIFLDRIPSGVSTDEIDYILTAKSVFLSGSDISHTWNPFSLTTPQSSFPQAELPPLVTFWLIGPLPLGLFTSKIVYSLFSTGIVGLLMLIVKKLIGEKEAILVGLVGALNPWLIFFGRTAYDVSIAVFFLLLAFYILLTFKKWKIFLAFPSFILAFYCYIGMKLILLPFAAVIIYFAWSQNKKYKKQYIFLFIACIILFAFYIYSSLHTPGVRLNELASPNMSSITGVVNDERRLSVKSPLTAIFSNKYIIFFKYSISKYLNAFSPNLLFLNGDGEQRFSVWIHGLFYYLDAIFLIIGSAVLFARKRSVFTLLLALSLIAPIPSVMSSVGNSYAVRSMFLAPIFIILIGVGIFFIIKKYNFTKLVIIIAYFLLFLNFFNIYFLRNPIYNSQSFNFSGRILAKYLSYQHGSTYVIDDNPRTPFKEYIFFNNALNRNTSNKIADDYKHKEFGVNNIHFITCKQSSEISKGSVVIYGGCASIHPSKSEVTIAQLSDGGSIYSIQNDKICSQYKLERYPNSFKFSDLSVERMPEKLFCQKFITKY